MGRPDFEDLEIYRLAEKLANEVWEMVEFGRVLLKIL